MRLLLDGSADRRCPAFAIMITLLQRRWRRRDDLDRALLRLGIVLAVALHFGLGL
ncbi:MAG TPA: hypothetical protein VMS43_14065 [Allosphingosinicella sp.]|nr:hypothetical protein [Allosphingosinicella sp.]